MESTIFDSTLILLHRLLLFGRTFTALQRFGMYNSMELHAYRKRRYNMLKVHPIRFTPRPRKDQLFLFPCERRHVCIACVTCDHILDVCVTYPPEGREM